jgi:large subunit ribosomal protein L23
MIDYAIVEAPLITEKGTIVGEKANQFVFRVRADASKGAIAQVIAEVFKVTVLKVRTANVMGKMRRVGRSQGRRTNWKKAYVTLKEGERIEFFEGV